MRPDGNMLSAPSQVQSATEWVCQLLDHTGRAELERIASPPGYSSPKGFWYDQTWDEWVLVVEGHAVLEFEDGDRLALEAGEYVMLPAGRKHRIASSSEESPTIWLALHLKPV
jgi:cupin 2 domain-containing protein